MIKSEVLNKEYKTIKGYLIAAKRYENSLREELNACYQKEGNMYLGDPILPTNQIRDLEQEINRIFREKLRMIKL